MKRFLVGVVILLAALSIGAAAVCLFAGWKGLEDYGTALFWAGVGTFILSALPTIGGGSELGSPDAQLARSAGHVSAHEAHLRDVKEPTSGTFYLLVMLTAGAISVGIGFLLAHGLA